MRVKCDGVEFERLAFVFSIREHPGERTTQLAYADWLTDHGYTAIGAKRIVTKLVREATDEWLALRVQAWLNGDGEDAMHIRHRIRFYLTALVTQATRIEVRATGDAPYTIDQFSELVNGVNVCGLRLSAPIDSPPMYDPARMNRSIGVGVRWVMRLCEDVQIQITGLNNQGGPFA